MILPGHFLKDGALVDEKALIVLISAIPLGTPFAHFLIGMLSQLFEFLHTLMTHTLGIKLFIKTFFMKLLDDTVKIAGHGLAYPL
jgi:hypothetical protein